MRRTRSHATTHLAAKCNVSPRILPLHLHCNLFIPTSLQNHFNVHTQINSSTFQTEKMSQEQPRRPQPGQDPIKYGDVFNVSGNLAKKPVAPEDAAMMQSAETRVLGQTQLGGAASVMQSAANQNERAGLVSHLDVNDVASDGGVTVSETQVPGRRIITEAVGGKVLLLLFINIAIFQMMTLLDNKIYTSCIYLL